MATSDPARMMGLSDRVGVLKPGARADILILASDLTVASMGGP
jgi:imidazolonepropionase-like amidohydrolase